MIRNEVVYMNGDGETSRDFCYVEDVTQANLLAATTTRPGAVNQVYDILAEGALAGRRRFNATAFLDEQMELYRLHATNSQQEGPASQKRRAGVWKSWGKRIFDLLLTIPMAILLLPLFALLWIGVRVKLGRPAIFRQQRPGLHGRPFTTYKFRTMTEGCDADGTLLPDGQRLTAFGQFLRRTSLDALPELFNVLKGEMSLVGPRPLLMDYLDRYTPTQMRRHDALPGITGLTQVSGRNDLTWEQKFSRDIWYVDHRSFWLDLKILALTVRAVLRCEGVSSSTLYRGPKPVDQNSGTPTLKEDTATRAINILFTSAGRRVELLKAFRRAYTTLGIKGLIIAVDIDPLAPALRVADHTYIVPRVDSQDYVSTLIDICTKERVTVVLPLIDPDVPVLCQHRTELEAAGVKVAVVSADAARICGDKWLTSAFFQRLGLAVPRSWLPGQIDPATAAYPLFIKPRGGSAAKNAFKINNARELNFFCSYVPDPIIEEYLPGPEITNDVICDLNGDVLAVVSRQRIEVRSGEVVKGVTINNPSITDACVTIAQALPAVGPITVQCIMKNNRPHFTEINARFGGGVPLGIASGVESPLWLLARLAEIDVPIPPLGSYRAGCYMTRFDDSFFLSETEYAQMASYRL